jgi:hypothetical protein
MIKKKEKKQNWKKISFFMKIMINLRKNINKLIKMQSKMIGVICTENRKKMKILTITLMNMMKTSLMNSMIFKIKMKIMMI